MVCDVAIWNVLLNMPITGQARNSGHTLLESAASVAAAATHRDAIIIGRRGPPRSIQRPACTAVNALTTPNDAPIAPIITGVSASDAAYSVMATRQPLKATWFSIDRAMWTCSGFMEEL